MTDIKVDLLQWSIKKTSGSGIRNENISNKELAEELHKLVIRKFKKRKVHAPFIDNVFDVDLADMQLISKFNKWIRFLLCIIDVFSKYARFIDLKDKKSTGNTNAFHKILDESTRKPNKIWVDKGNKFHNRSIKPFLQSKNTEIYSTYNEGKFVVVERFTRTLKNKIYKYMTPI